MSLKDGRSSKNIFISPTIPNMLSVIFCFEAISRNS